jgi:hypothetical protein
LATATEAAAVFLLLAVGLGLRLRVSRGWAYGGADTYGYMKLADQLRLHHKYQLPDGKTPYFAKPPGYPLFLAMVWRDMKDWGPIVRTQAWIDVVGTGLCVYFLARRLRGAIAGLIALALAMTCPFTLVFTSAALTECLAAFFTTAAAALLVAGPGRAGLRWLGAGALTGLGTMLRVDGALVTFAFLPALACVGRRERVRVAALGALGFVVVFGPWIARNLVFFGRPYFVGEHVDRQSQPLPHYDGYYHWVATWARDDAPMSGLVWCFYDRKCPVTTRNYPADAFESPQEAVQVATIFDERNREGVTAGVAAEFEKLAAARRSHRPSFTRVKLPLIRMWNLWVNRHDDLLRDPKWRPWPEMFAKVNPYFDRLGLLLTLLLLGSSALCLAVPSTRRVAAVLVTLIGARTMVFAYSYHVEPRYVVEVIPVGLALIGGAMGILLRRPTIPDRTLS